MMFSQAPEPGSYKAGGQTTSEAESGNSWTAHDDILVLPLQLDFLIPFLFAICNNTLSK
jgi:hypothetical protein